MKNIYENYFQVKESIAKAANTSLRNVEDITLVAVTKNRAWQDILPLYESGCRHFGESRVQEALLKMDEAPQDVQWHFIGSLQKNKVKEVVGRFVLIHGVDSLELAAKISECSQHFGIVTSVLLQVNISGELTKHGFTESGLEDVFDKILGLKGLRVEGLMTMAPLVEDEKIIRRCFSGLRLLMERLNLQLLEGGKLKTLSMGMSHDYKIAIEEGATIVRVGSALFHQ